MADNIEVTPGTGATIAGDDIGGALHQRVKVVLGDDGVSDGDLSAANPMPVSVGTLPLPADAATETTLAALEAKIPASPATEGGNLATIATNTTGLNNLSKNGGTMDATTLRVVTASDGPLNTNLGATADAAVVTDTTGTLSGKLRGLIKWAFERMPASLGQKTMANSLPVCLASDETKLGITSGLSVVNAGAANFTITLASLASSTAGVGRQSTLITNTAGYKSVLVFVKIKLGTSPTGSKGVYIYGLRDNGSGVADDAAGASDAAITVLNAPLLGVLQDKASPATGDVLVGAFLFHNPGPKFGIAIVHDTGVNLDATEGNHGYSYVGQTEANT